MYPRVEEQKRPADVFPIFSLYMQCHRSAFLALVVHGVITQLYKKAVVCQISVNFSSTLIIMILHVICGGRAFVL